MSSIPETSAIALPAEPTGISGVAVDTAMATVDAPATSNMIPRTICRFLIGSPGQDEFCIGNAVFDRAIG